MYIGKAAATTTKTKASPVKAAANAAPATEVPAAATE